MNTLVYPNIPMKVHFNTILQNIRSLWTFLFSSAVLESHWGMLFSFGICCKTQQSCQHPDVVGDFHAVCSIIIQVTDKSCWLNKRVH